MPATGSSSSVTADRRGLRSDPDNGRIEVVEHDDGVTICAGYSREGNVSEPGNGGHLGTPRNNVKVEFTVEVPSGIDFVARTVNSGVWKPTTSAATS